ncbi:RICIN domain-containing protein [Kitasatospora sp. NPDC047058]|uniref:RICIN domain-containing protein n=1 Tax=Kitasatospora sp. NPDC047058 TaxID=3155620 RepID=UPI0033D3E862
MISFRRLRSAVALLASLLAVVVATASPAQAYPRDWGYLYNQASAWCADLPDTGPVYNTYVYEHECVRDWLKDNQLWGFQAVPDVLPRNRDGSVSQAFVIRNGKSQQCMDLPGTGWVAKGTQVWMHDCVPNTGDNQLWYWDRSPSDHYYELRHLATGWCLDVDGWGGQQNGQPLTLYTCSKDETWPPGASEDDDHLWSVLGPQ